MRIGLTSLVIPCGVLLSGCFGTPPDERMPAATLTNADSSAEALIDRFLDALAAKDPDALRTLRVTEAEYREILMPGNVPPGTAPRRPSRALGDLAWGLVDTKSRYYEQALLTEFGGRRLRRKAVGYEDGEAHMANHTVHKQLRVKVEDEAIGTEEILETGSIVEVAGRFKFASFIRD
jgi:hypothetical protein